MPDFTFEQDLLDKGYRNVAGIDECSRGSLIGPVYACAVVMDLDLIDLFKEHVNDSKKLTEKKRGAMNDLITTSCKWSIGESSSSEIDVFNILNATKLAMQRAVAGLNDVDFLLIDGNMKFDDIFDIPYQSIVKGDAKCLSIASASIVAKTYQCSQMRWFDRMYPGYGLASNKGYGTKKHCKAIEELGPCEIHRKTFKRVREYIK